MTGFINIGYENYLAGHSVRIKGMCRAAASLESCTKSVYDRISRSVTDRFLSSTKRAVTQYSLQGHTLRYVPQVRSGHQTRFVMQLTVTGEYMKLFRASLFMVCFAISLNTSAAPLPCTSYNGVPVPYIANPNLNNVGVAHRMRNGQPIIQINPNVVAPLPEYVRQFWYAHECAHHALHPSRNSEVAADCYAIKAIRSIGIINHPQQIRVLLNYISRLPGSIQTGHLPGPARARNLYTCFNSP